MTTAQVIDDIVEHTMPVRRLRPPLARAGIWLGFATVVLGLFIVCHGVRTDVGPSFAHPAFALTIAASFATGVLAAIAAFALSIPDRSRLSMLLPAPAFAVWIGTIGYGCLTDWISVGPNGIEIGETLECFATMILTSVPLAVTLALMMRYAALLRPGLVALMGGLAVAAITSATHALLHGVDASLMILVWNLGTVVLITGIASLINGGVFAWINKRAHVHLAGLMPR